MDEIEVNIVQAQVCQGLLAGWLHILWLVAGVPQLADHKDVTAGAIAFFEGCLEPSTNLGFISIHGSTVDMAVADLQS